MGTLILKDDLLDRVAKLAAQRHSSVEVEAEGLLLDSLDRREAAVEARRVLDAIAAMTPPGVRQTDAVELLREDRAR